MLKNDKKKAIIGAAAVIIVAAMAVALSIYQFAAALNKNGVSDDSSISVATNFDKVEPLPSNSAGTAPSIIEPASNSAPIDLSKIKKPLDLLENENFMEKMREAGLSDGEILAALEKLQEYLPRPEK